MAFVTSLHYVDFFIHTLVSRSFNDAFLFILFRVKWEITRISWAISWERLGRKKAWSP